MMNSTLTKTLLVALLCFVFLSISTLALPKISWPKPSELAASQHYQEVPRRLGDSKVGWACTSVPEPNVPPSSRGLPNIPQLPNIPNIPQLPNIPKIPNIPSLPNIPHLPSFPDLPDLPSLPDIPRLPDLPGLPNLPLLPPFQSVVLSHSAETEKCLTNDGSKTSEKCFSQIFSSWADNDFALDKECCEIVLKMDRECNRHVHMFFKSPFFAPLLQYSCHIKHTNN
ncbi:unnamed protein product [Cochlearia groenlandica]